MTAIDTTAARRALVTIRAAATGQTPISDKAMNLHTLTDLTPEDAQLVVTVAEQWGPCAGVNLAAGLAEAATVFSATLGGLFTKGSE